MFGRKYKYKEVSFVELPRNVFLTILLFLLIVIVYLTIYFFSNYHEFRHLLFTYESDTFTISGNATFTNERNTLNLTDFRYLDSERPSDDYDFIISLYYDGKAIFTDNSSTDNNSVKKYFDNYQISLSEANGFNQYFTDEIIDNFDQTYLQITIRNNGKSLESFKVPLKTLDEYSNDKFFYKKEEHI